MCSMVPPAEAQVEPADLGGEVRHAEVVEEQVRLLDVDGGVDVAADGVAGAEEERVVHVPADGKDGHGVGPRVHRGPEVQLHLAHVQAVAGGVLVVGGVAADEVADDGDVRVEAGRRPQRQRRAGCATRRPAARPAWSARFGRWSGRGGAGALDFSEHVLGGALDGVGGGGGPRGGGTPGRRRRPLVEHGLEAGDLLVPPAEVRLVLSLHFVEALLQPAHPVVGGLGRRAGGRGRRLGGRRAGGEAAEEDRGKQQPRSAVAAREPMRGGMVVSVRNRRGIDSGTAGRGSDGKRGRQRRLPAVAPFRPCGRWAGADGADRGSRRARATGGRPGGWGSKVRKATNSPSSTSSGTQPAGQQRHVQLGVNVAVGVVVNGVGRLRLPGLLGRRRRRRVFTGVLEVVYEFQRAGAQGGEPQG